MFWAFACNEVHPDNRALILTPHTQSLTRLSDAQPHPLCTILTRLDGPRRGASVDLRWVDGALLVLEAPSDIEAYQERNLCVLNASTLLAATHARFEALPYAMRGTLLLHLHATGVSPNEREAYASALDVALLNFAATEQLWFASSDIELLRVIRGRMDASKRLNIRYALILQDQNAAVGHTSLAEAMELADLALVPAPLYDAIYDDIAVVAWREGGTSIGAYNVDSIPSVDRVRRHDGLRMIIGELAGELEPVFGIAPGGGFACTDFIAAEQLEDPLFNTCR